MYKVSVEITGTSDMLHSRMPTETEAIKRLDELGKILKKDVNNEKAYTEAAEYCLYKNSNKEICIPSMHIEAAMVKAGARERVEGEGKKSYKDYMNAFIIVEPKLIPIEPQKYELFRTFVKTYGGRVMSTRPKFPQGWKANFTIAILDDTIPVKVVESILKYAGAYVGIGNWRPKFGRFEVTKFGKQ